mmetsp:Transcript_15595/g.13320  ORF Transcript_15595/g.13320 Transcript_15595/m.13320 type:complete len:128 (-) Transcript_15595:546-929(-)
MNLNAKLNELELFKELSQKTREPSSQTATSKLDSFSDAKSLGDFEKNIAHLDLSKLTQADDCSSERENKIFTFDESEQGPSSKSSPTEKISNFTELEEVLSPRTKYMCKADEPQQQPIQPTRLSFIK